MRRHQEGGEREILDTPEKRAEYFVSIFGTGGDKEGDQKAIKNASAIAAQLIDQGFSIATGGYRGGVMKAATEAAAEKAKELGAKPSERVKAFTLKPSAKIKEVESAAVVRSESLPQRLDKLTGSDAMVVLKGGLGTIVELLVTLENERIGKVFNEQKPAKPVIIIDESLTMTDLLSELAKQHKKLKDPEILNNSFILNLEPQAAELATKIIEAYYQEQLTGQPEIEAKKELNKYSLGNYLAHKKNFEQGEGI